MMINKKIKCIISNPKLFEIDELGSTSLVNFTENCSWVQNAYSKPQADRKYPIKTKLQYSNLNFIEIVRK